MSEQKVAKKEKEPQPSQLICPCCQSPMIKKSVPGFGGAERLSCTNLTCTSHLPARGWGG